MVSTLIQVFRNAIAYWNRCIRLQLRVLPSHESIKRLAKRIGEYEGISSSLSVCITRLKLAHNEYTEAKKEASKWRTEFQETFVTAKAKEEGLSEAVVIKQMKREKELKEKGLNSRIIRGRNNKSPVVRAIVTEPDGVGYEVDTPEGIV